MNKLLQQIWRRVLNAVGGNGMLRLCLNSSGFFMQRRQTAEQDDGADATRRSIGLRLTIRFLSGASRRPSSGCSGQSLLRTSSHPLLPLIRSPLCAIMEWRQCH